MNKWLIVTAVILGVCVLLALLGGAAFVLLSASATQPAVQINSPVSGERLELAHPVTIHAIARDDGKIKRVELWVDDKLVDAQSSSLPGGASPFPLTTQWQARTEGAHTITVRAFNVAGGQGHASVSVSAAQIADRDRDNVPDETDLCPDQSGTLAAGGCPDRDGDTVADASDACPDTPGPADGRGCPVASAQDADGDGVLDVSDACPAVPGSAATAGCPDADGDGVRDSEDACPREAGPADGGGCSTPGDADSDGVPDASDVCPTEAGTAAASGCPDEDGDGVRDTQDTCLGSAGPAALAGCPDADADGVRDALDLCPSVPGPASNAGCPATGSGDSDGDGVLDGTDLVPGEAGSAESGGGPIPGGGADGDGDGIPGDEEIPPDPLDDVAGAAAAGERLSGVTFEALDFELSQDYVARTQIYCYARLGSAAEDQIGPFDFIAGRRWNIAEYVGGDNSKFLTVPTGTPLAVWAECYATYRDHTGTDHLFQLGALNASHAEADWDGHVITSESAAADGGHFQVKYRLCRGSCRTSEFPSPMLSLFTVSGRRQFVWIWSGDRATINGFRINMGTMSVRFGAHTSSTYMPASMTPPCGQRLAFRMTAYRGDRESPYSNIVYATGERCPRTVRVTFDTLRTGDLARDGTRRDVGPIYGSFGASAAAEQSISFNTNDYRLRPNAEHSIQGIIDASRSDAGERLLDSLNRVEIDLGPHDDLTINGEVKDRDLGSDDTLFWVSGLTIRSGDIAAGEYTVSDRHITLVYHIEILSSP